MPIPSLRRTRASLVVSDGGRIMAYQPDPAGAFQHRTKGRVTVHHCIERAAKGGKGLGLGDVLTFSALTASEIRALEDHGVTHFA